MFTVTDAPHATHLIWTRRSVLQSSFFVFFNEHSVTPSGLVKTWITGTQCVSPTGWYTRSSKLLPHRFLTHLVTACADVKESDCYYMDATWYSLPVVNTFNLHNVTYHGYNFPLTHQRLNF
jgi:hypothetical protein